jgi:hypothetical protein
VCGCYGCVFHLPVWLIFLVVCISQYHAHKNKFSVKIVMLNKNKWSFTFFFWPLEIVIFKVFQTLVFLQGSIPSCFTFHSIIWGRTSLLCSWLNNGHSFWLMFLWAVFVGSSNDVEVLSLMCVAIFFNSLLGKTEIPGPTQSLSRIFFSLIKTPFSLLHMLYHLLSWTNLCF